MGSGGGESADHAHRAWATGTTTAHPSSVRVLPAPRAFIAEAAGSKLVRAEAPPRGAGAAARDPFQAPCLPTPRSTAPAPWRGIAAPMAIPVPSGASRPSERCSGGLPARAATSAADDAAFDCAAAGRADDDEEGSGSVCPPAADIGPRTRSAYDGGGGPRYAERRSGPWMPSPGPPSGKEAGTAAATDCTAAKGSDPECIPSKWCLGPSGGAGSIPGK